MEENDKIPTLNILIFNGDELKDDIEVQVVCKSENSKVKIKHFSEDLYDGFVNSYSESVGAEANLTIKHEDLLSFNSFVITIDTNDDIEEFFIDGLNKTMIYRINKQLLSRTNKFLIRNCNYADTTLNDLISSSKTYEHISRFMK